MRFGLSAAVRDRAREAALALGERLLEAWSCAHDDGEFLPMRGLAGSAGFALVFLALAQYTGESRYEAAMHDFMRTAAQVDDFPAIGLFDGIAGTRAVAHLLAGLEARYERLVDQCDAFIDAHVPLWPKLPQTFAEFDLIAGYSGTRLGQCVGAPRPADRLTELIAWVLEDEWRWCCVHPVRGGDPENDLGLAHGVAGMLAALALTLEDFGDRRDLVASCSWKLANRVVFKDGMHSWPYTAQDRSPERFRAAWCYGAPGVCSALLACARACDDADLKRFALDALRSVAAQPPAAWNVGEAGICHGMLGNALIFASASGIAECSELAERAEQIADRAISVLAAEDWRCMAIAEDAKPHSAFSHLVGSAGAITALLTLTRDFDSQWMRIYAIEPLA